MKPEQRFEKVLRLYPREVQVLSLMGKGMSGPQIALRLGLAKSTAWTYMNRIQTRLGLGGYREVIAYGAAYNASGLKRMPILPEDVRYRFTCATGE